MAQWDYTIKWGKQLHEAIYDEDAEMVVKCLIACYRELLNKLSDEDKDWKQFDIEDAIFNLENFDESEDVDDYLECFYDICDDVRAWIAI
jgi:hypothetical protein